MKKLHLEEVIPVDVITARILLTIKTVFIQMKLSVYSKNWELITKKNVKYGIITMTNLVIIAIVDGFTLKDRFKTKIMSAKQMKLIP